MFSSFLTTTAVKLKGLYCPSIFLLYFLKIGVTFADFQSAGTKACARDLLNRDATISSFNFFKNVGILIVYHKGFYLFSYC